MAKSYRQTLIDCAVHDRLVEVRRKLSEQASSTDKLIGIGTVIDILLNHAELVMPDSEWLKAQLDAAPRRGRPRSSTSEFVPAPRGVNADTRKKHDWCVHPTNPAIKVCRKCPAWTRDNISEYLSDDPCSNTKHTTAKIMLLDAGFTAEQLAWLDD